jgi:hypothetical protein
VFPDGARPIVIALRQRPGSARGDACHRSSALKALQLTGFSLPTGLGRRQLPPLGFLMPPLLDGGTLGWQGSNEGTS